MLEITKDIRFIIYSYLDIEETIIYTKYNKKEIKEYCDTYTVQFLDKVTAIKNGRYYLIKFYFYLGLEFNEYDLQKACCFGYLNIVKFLLKKGITYSINDLNVLCGYNQTNLVQYFMNRGMNPTVIGLKYCIRSRNYELAKYILQKGIIPDFNVLSSTITQGNYELSKYICDLGVLDMNDIKDPQPLDDMFFCAAENKYYDILEYLLKIGYQINNHIIIKTITQGHLNILKFLLRNKAILDKDILDICAGSINLKMFKFLIKKGLRPIQIYDLSIKQFNIINKADPNLFLELINLVIQGEDLKDSKFQDFIIENSISNVKNYIYYRYS